MGAGSADRAMELQGCRAFAVEIKMKAALSQPNRPCLLA
jgi:hypothetical protein